MALRILDSPESLAREAAAEFDQIAAASVAARDRFTVALAGGATPRTLYRLLADERAPYLTRVPWESTHVFFGDERMVPPDDPDSNARMAFESLLRHVPVPEEQVHRIRGENPDPDRAAEEYEEMLRATFRLAGHEAPRFDLVLLGLGADGHTASLFPGDRALRESERLVSPATAPVPPTARVTLTLPVLNAASSVLFLVSGGAKAAAVQRIRRGDELPAARVRPQSGTLLWLCDRAAAGPGPA
jgi:6-phosphogluconolactonase